NNPKSKPSSTKNSKNYKNSSHKKGTKSSGALISTLRNLCVLCASAVKETQKACKRRGAEDAEITQRNLKPRHYSKSTKVFRIRLLCFLCLFVATVFLNSGARARYFFAASGCRCQDRSCVRGRPWGCRWDLMDWSSA